MSSLRNRRGSWWSGSSTRTACRKRFTVTIDTCLHATKTDLQHWLDTIHSPKHLRRYVNEAVFRLNEGNCGIDTGDWMEALVRQMRGSRRWWKDLIADNALSAEAAPA